MDGRATTHLADFFNLCLLFEPAVDVSFPRESSPQNPATELLAFVLASSRSSETVCGLLTTCRSVGGLCSKTRGEVARSGTGVAMTFCTTMLTGCRNLRDTSRNKNFTHNSNTEHSVAGSSAFICVRCFHGQVEHSILHTQSYLPHIFQELARHCTKCSQSRVISWIALLGISLAL